MLEQLELPLWELSITYTPEHRVVIADRGYIVFSIKAETLDDVRRSLRKRRLDPRHTQSLIDAVDQAGVVQSDADAAPF